MINPITTILREFKGTDTVKIGILGDISSHNVTKLDESFFRPLIPIFSSVDLVIANVETVISDHLLKPVKRAGTFLQSKKTLASVLHNIGIDVALLANNHIDDFGQVGIDETRANLENAGILCFGLKELNDVIVKRKNISFMLSGYVTPYENRRMLPTYGSAPNDLANHFGPPDEVLWLYFLHGFEELYSYPFPWRVSLLNAIRDKYDPATVIAGHQHVYQGYYDWNGVPICASYGNGFLNIEYHKRNQYSKQGCFSVLSFDREGCFRIDEYPYLFEQGGVAEMSLEEMTLFKARLKTIRSVIADDERLTKFWEVSCYENWVPQGYKAAFPFIFLYDLSRFRHLKRMMHATVFNRNAAFTYLKKQWKIDLFKYNDNEILADSKPINEIKH